MTTRPRYGRWLLPVVTALALSCDADEPTTKVQLILAPDPERNSPEQVALQVGRIEVVVDGPGGLGGVTKTGATAGGATAEDRDEDGQLEAVFLSPALDRQVLPVLEVGLVDNVGRALEYGLVGYAGPGMPAAEGVVALGVASTTCTRGDLCKLGVPFNLLARARAPKVVMSVPPDGTKHIPPDMPYLTVVFSTTVDPNTVTGNVTMKGVRGHEPSTAVEMLEVLYGGPGGPQEQRSMLRLRFAERLSDHGYLLTVGPGIVGENGLEFDQHPEQPGADPFESRFGELVGSFGCPQGFERDPQTNACAPILACTLAGCADGYLCHEPTETCVEDCRVFEVCFAPGTRCDPDTGLCG